jgi:hypothetical protein
MASINSIVSSIIMPSERTDICGMYPPIDKDVPFIRYYGTIGRQKHVVVSSVLAVIRVSKFTNTNRGSPSNGFTLHQPCTQYEPHSI